MMFFGILAVICLYYIVTLAIFIIGLLRVGKCDADKSTDIPFVSIIIAARNEEKNIEACLRSAVKQSYQQDKYEVILVNDNSTDRTLEIAEAIISPNLRIIKNAAPSALKGKSNALAQGIDKAKGEIIMMTDADCIVPPTWVEYAVKRFTPDVGIVGSVTLQRSLSAFSGMQSLDFTFIQGIAAASIALKIPLSVIGNNLYFRKKAYDEVGGYRGIAFSITEDFALFKAITKTKHWDYRFPLDPKILVISEPCPTWIELIRQKRRWGKGGLDINFIGLSIMTAGFLLHLTLLYLLIFGFFESFAALLTLKFIGDYFYLRNVLLQIGKPKELKYFFAFELYYIPYVILLPFMVLFGGKIVWKDRTF